MSSNINKNIFKDFNKFKKLKNGKIAYKTDCSNWVNVLMNNLPIDDKIQSEYVVPKISIEYDYTYELFYILKNTNKFKEQQNEYDKCDCCYKIINEQEYITWIKMKKGLGNKNLSVCTDCYKELKEYNDTLSECYNCQHYDICYTAKINELFSPLTECYLCYDCDNYYVCKFCGTFCGDTLCNFCRLESSW